MLTIKNIHTESGRGISGELDSIDGEINIGSVEWLNSKGVIIDRKSKEILETEENKSHSVIGVCINKKLLGFILLGDLLREDTISSVQKLRNDNYNIKILSGDRKETVVELAKKLDSPEAEIKWDLLPEMKLKIIENLKKSNKVAMIGDCLLYTSDAADE